MKKKSTKKTSGCLCPFCNEEITVKSVNKVPVCQPCGVNFTSCASCGEIMAESVMVCSKCGAKRKK